MVTFQPSLLDGGPGVELATHVSTERRMPLAEGAWVDFMPGWARGSDTLFDRLLTCVPWRAERRHMFGRVLDVPRLVAFYQSGQVLPDPALEEMKAATLTVRYLQETGEPFCTVGLCLYRDGRDSVAWHGDRSGRSLHEDTAVAIVSLGSSRRFLLRPREGGKALRYNLGRGDLLVMGGSCQRTWNHCVPKSAIADGPRISVQFRLRDVR